MSAVAATAAGRRPSPRVAVVVGVVAVAAASVAAMVASDEGRAWPSRAEVQAYQDRVYPLASEWGRIEMQGMRPAIGDLSSGEGVPAEAVATEAQAWASTLARIRGALEAVPVPDGLRAAHATFLRALDEYLAAARLFEAAATGPAEARKASIEAGIARARAGARLYNEASMDLQAARKHAGMGETDLFPRAPAEEG